MLSEAAEQEEGHMKEVLEEASRKEAERGPQTEATKTAASVYEQMMSDFGVKKDARPKRASDIARLIKVEADFNPMFKVCSKIMHRTALSIASSTMPASLDEVNPFLRNRSASDLLMIYDSISKHVEKKGLRPPEN
jgi:hypothetical protein